MTALHQMRYYRWIVVPTVAKAKRMDADQAHEWAKREIFGRSTTLFTDEEFESRLSEIRSRMAAEGVWIPRPNEDQNAPNPPDPYE